MVCVARRNAYPRRRPQNQYSHLPALTSAIRLSSPPTEATISSTTFPLIFAKPHSTIQTDWKLVDIVNGVLPSNLSLKVIPSRQLLSTLLPMVAGLWTLYRINR